MIVLEDVTKTVRAHGSRRTILSAANLEIPSDRCIALLGPHADTHAMIELLAGIEKPNTGRVARHAQVSFPVGQLHGLSGELSVRNNVAHIARLYGADVRRTLNLVEMILEIGPRFDRPHAALDRALRAQLADIVSLCLPFDTYLFASDKLLRRCRAALSRDREPDLETRIAILVNSRFRSAGMIVATADAGFAREFCDVALVLHEGRLAFIEPAQLEPKAEKPPRTPVRAPRAAMKQIRK